MQNFCTHNYYKISYIILRILYHCPLVFYIGSKGSEDRVGREIGYLYILTTVTAMIEPL